MMNALFPNILVAQILITREINGQKTDANFCKLLLAKNNNNLLILLEIKTNKVQCI